MSAEQMTAAGHFAEAELLLRQAKGAPAVTAAARATQAQAHIAAARFLWDLQKAEWDDHGRAGLRKAGLRGLADQRYAKPTPAGAR
jgi:hypothetical protein